MNDELNFDDLLSHDGEKPLSDDQLGMTATRTEPSYSDDNQEVSDEEYYGGGQNSEDNVLYDFMKDHGIEDPSKIKYVDDNNEIVDVDFNSLSKEEQLEILKGMTQSNITEQEKADLNFLRQNRMNLDQFRNAVSQNSVQNFVQQHQEMIPQKTYQIDDYTDDELYLADLKSKFPDFTDDELLSKLESAKDDEDLYQKEVNSIRSSYKADEDAYIAQQQQAQQRQVYELQQNLVNAARNFNEVLLDDSDPNSDSLVVEDSDREQILSYLLDQDSQGKSQLVRDLENPNTLIQLAWLRLQGQNAITNTTRYWRDTLKETRKENARLQKELDKLNGKDNSVVVPSKPKNQSETSDLGKVWKGLI